MHSRNNKQINHSNLKSLTVIKHHIHTSSSQIQTIYQVYVDIRSMQTLGLCRHQVYVDVFLLLLYKCSQASGAYGTDVGVGVHLQRQYIQHLGVLVWCNADLSYFVNANELIQCCNDLMHLQQWPCYLQVPGFKSRLQLWKISSLTLCYAICPTNQQTKH